MSMSSIIVEGKRAKIYLFACLKDRQVFVCCVSAVCSQRETSRSDACNYNIRGS